MRNAMWAAFAAIVTSGCVSTDPAAGGAFPTNWEEMVRSQIRATFYDPYSIRDARVSRPLVGSFNFRSGWVVCFEANAKNRMGAYTGRQRVGYMIQNNRIVDSGLQVHLCDAPQTYYIPFDVGG